MTQDSHLVYSVHPQLTNGVRHVAINERTGHHCHGQCLSSLQRRCVGLERLARLETNSAILEANFGVEVEEFDRLQNVLDSRSEIYFPVTDAKLAKSKDRPNEIYLDLIFGASDETRTFGFEYQALVALCREILRELAPTPEDEILAALRKLERQLGSA